MKQLTFILILFFPLALFNCSDQNIKPNKIQKKAAQSRSIANINQDNCTDTESITTQEKKSILQSKGNRFNSGQSSFQLPSLSNKDLIQFEEEINIRDYQSIFDDFDPEKI